MANPGQLGAILLAAGGSSRLGHSKQLLEIDGQALVKRQARTLLSLNPACVVVVTGAEADGVRAQLAEFPVELVHNTDWESGMGRSLACGIRAMPERVRGALVLLCDQWRISSDDIAELAGAWADNPQAAVASAFRDTFGSPAILPRAMFDRVSRLQGDSGARRILKKWHGEVIEVPIDNAAVDIDSPHDIPK